MVPTVPFKPGMSPLAAHNAVAALVELYAGILRDAEHRERLLTAQVVHLQAQVERLSATGKRLPVEPETKGEFGDAT